MWFLGGNFTEYEKYLSVIKGSGIFKGIDDKTIRKILNGLRYEIKTYKNNEMILDYTEQVRYMYLILEGGATIFRDDYWGNRSIIMKLGAGQGFGISFSMSDKGVAEAYVVSDGESVVMIFNMKIITDPGLIKQDFYPTLISNVISMLANRNIFLSEKIEHISQRHLRDKILSYLSGEANKRHMSAFDIPFSRKELAEYLCADRSALSAELARLKKEGILDYNKNHFTIKAAAKRTGMFPYEE